MKYNKIPIEVSIYLRYLHQDGKVSGKELVKRFPQYSKRSIYRHASLPLGVKVYDKRKQNKGRPYAVDERGVTHVWWPIAATQKN